MKMATANQDEKAMKHQFARHYIIFVRPPGSHVWTQHMKKRPDGDIPWRTHDCQFAMDEAMRIAKERSYCCAIHLVDLPKDLDQGLTIRMPDGDSTFFCSAS